MLVELNLAGNLIQDNLQLPAAIINKKEILIFNL